MVWAVTRLPSMPSHQKRSCGKRFVSLHLSFAVKEAGDTGPPQELRDAGREAEGVGQPGDRRAVAEPALEKPLAVEELAHEGLAARHLAVGLAPGSPDRLPASLRHALPHPLEEGRVVLLDPGVELRRGLVVGEVLVAVHQPEHARERPAPLAPRLGERPQPREVYVRVPVSASPPTGGYSSLISLEPRSQKTPRLLHGQPGRLGQGLGR
jgi:hypothetical protein